MSTQVPTARARLLGPAFDLLAAYRPGGFVFERSGLGVAGVGEAARIEAEGGPGREARLAAATAEILARIRREESAPPPIAVGSLPFDEGEPATLSVPSIAVRRPDPASTWLLALGDAETWEPERVRPRGPSRAFAPVHIHPEPEPGRYEEAVAEAIRRIRTGGLGKVVLARSEIVEAGRSLDPKALLARLRAVDPDCYSFAARAEPGRTLVGASPELLLARRGREVTATPLAGSAPRSGDPAADRAAAEALRSSAKDREEHAYVAEAVAAGLAPLCEELARPAEPTLVRTASVWHLATPFRGLLKEPPAGALELVGALHPTPAVCGSPREEARAAIGELESIRRGGYAGPVGWVDAEGDGTWAIALRCAEIEGDRARLFAGAGIVAESVPAKEVEETERKFLAFLESLRWG